MCFLGCLPPRFLMSSISGSHTLLGVLSYDSLSPAAVRQHLLEVSDICIGHMRLHTQNPKVTCFASNWTHMLGLEALLGSATHCAEDKLFPQVSVPHFERMNYPRLPLPAWRDPLGALVGLSYHQAIVQTVPNSLTFELEKGK